MRQPVHQKLPETENDVKALIKQWFVNLGGYSFAVVASHGLGVHGISDRVGVVPIEVTPQMVGKTVGLFVAIEAKKPGRRGEKRGGATQNQVDFLCDVIDHGGLGALVDCEPDLELLAEAVALARLTHANAGHAVSQALTKRISGNG